ncbi:aspartic peptidase domain-containing protein [Aspergillus undulatus]|uniref:aspartic peptidase domain-containing protein n=1 Tax=Aspergillus undulatus TaxID=1810928 RepID=UPI003CCD7FEF
MRLLACTGALWATALMTVRNTLAASPNASSILDSLVENGQIDSRSFSLWNNSKIDEQAEVLFGGVNTAKYHGVMQIHSIPENSAPSLPVQVNYHFSSLPEKWKDLIYSALNITETSIDCARRTENHTISLVIGDATISGPWSNFIFQYGSLNVGEGTEEDADAVCYIFIGTDPDDPRTPTIGSEFVRNTYLAVDYDSKMVGLAPLSTDPARDDIRSLEDAAGVQGSGTAGSTSAEDENATDGAMRAAVSGWFGLLLTMLGLTLEE